VSGRKPLVLVTGASNQVGYFLLPRLLHAGYRVLAIARHRPDWVPSHTDLNWRCRDLRQGYSVPDPLHAVVHMAPLAVFAGLEQSGAGVVVAVSSTSIVVKRDSSDAAEKAVAAELSRGEAAVRAWAQANAARASIVRPTLVYGCGRDRNVTRLAHWIGRWPIFPCLGQASGGRQPLHADDLAQAIQALLEIRQPPALLTLPGGEVLSYRDMVVRIATALGRPLRCLSLPGWLWRAVLVIAHRTGRWRDIHPAMLERMNDDLVFPLDDWNVTGVQPRPFEPRFPPLPLDDPGC